MIVAKNKCGTCAYRQQPRLEDLDMAVAYHFEKPEPHACHERKNDVRCHGANEITERIRSALSSGRLGPGLVLPEVAFAGIDLSDPASVETVHHRRLCGIAEALGFHPGQIRSYSEKAPLQKAHNSERKGIL